MQHLLPPNKPHLATTLTSIHTAEDLQKLVPDRPIPEWILQQKAGRRKRAHYATDAIPLEVLDYRNLKHTWRGRKESAAARAEDARLHNLSSPDLVRKFPSDLRPSKVIQGSAVAEYAEAHGTRRVFSLPPCPELSSNQEEQQHEALRAEDSTYSTTVSILVQEAESSVHSSIPVDNPAFLRLDQSRMPLQAFDQAEFVEADRSPTEWVSMRADALAPWYEGEVYTWKRCRVKAYDENTGLFSIIFLPISEPKTVCRFNLRFDKENKETWERRRLAAWMQRERLKERTRLYHFVTIQPDAAVMPIGRFTLRDIFYRIVKGLPKRIMLPEQESEQGQYLKHLAAEAIQSYSRAVKTAIVHHRVKLDPVFRKKYHELRLPALPETAPVPKRAKILVPEHHFRSHMTHLAQTHICTKERVLATMHWLYAKWDTDFAQLILMDIVPEASLRLPSSLEDFKTLQQRHNTNILERLGQEWRRALIEYITDNLSEVYDLFQSNPRYNHQSALWRFLKQIELRMIDQLGQLVERSLKSWCQFVRECCATAANIPMISSSPARQLPLLKVELIIKDDQVTISPDEAEIQNFFGQVIDNVGPSIRSLQTIDSTVMALLYLEERILYRIGMDDPVFEPIDQAILAARKQVTSMTRKALEGPSELSARFTRYIPLMNLETEQFVTDFDLAIETEIMEEYDHGQKQKSPTDPSGSSPEQPPYVRRFHKYRRKLQELHRAASDIWKESFNTECFPLIQVETSRVKASFAAKAIELRDALLSRMDIEIREHNQSIIQQYEEIVAHIAQRPRTEHELTALRDFTAQSRNEVQRIAAEAREVRHHMDLLEEFHFALPQEEHITAWSLIECPKKVEESAHIAEERLKEDKVRMIDRIVSEKERFDLLLTKLHQDVQSAKVYDEYDRFEAVTEEMNTLQEAVKDACHKARDFNAREKIFDFPATEYPLLKLIEEELQPFHQLWNIIYEFRTNRKEWLEGAFLDLQAEQIDSQVIDWWKASFKLAKVLEGQYPGPAACARKLREETTEFKEHLPVIQYLASPALKARHWEALSQQVGQEIDPDEELTLNTLLNLGLESRLDSIQEIYLAAKKEFELEASLSNMKAEWGPIAFEVLPHRSTGTFIISGLSDIVVLLDDHLAKTQTMRSSSFIKPIEQLCKDWEARLKYAQALLDEWMEYQRTWIYLEPIFSSEDIMRQLPTEARRFNAVDALWRKTMADAKMDPGFMVQCDPERKLKDKFQAANQKLEEIQKGLNDYLETKRLYFPRFFFLSNDELLEILSQTKEPRAVQPHLNKAFEGIAKVRFEKDLKITEMISAQGEVVKLTGSVDPESGPNKGNVEKWLLELEQLQWASLNSHTVDSMHPYNSQDRSQWILGWPAQIVLSVSQLFWTMAVESNLRQSGCKGLEPFLERLNTQLRDVVKLVRGDLNYLARSTLAALVVIDVHARDVVKRMVDLKVDSQTDFEWISQLRYSWEPSWKDGQAVRAGDKTMVVRIVNARCLYGYEYLGNTARLVITPLTDRCYRTMIGAIDLLYGGAPEGPAGTGKTETVKDLSKAVAIHCVVFNCSDGLDYLAMAKFFKGLAGCGSWCCFDEFNRINIEVLSVIAQQILTINKAKRAGVDKFHFEGTYMKLNPNANAFITMNPGYAGRAELPDNLKALFRPCAMMVPDYGLIAEIRLYSFGFEDARANAQKLVRVLQLSSQKHYDYGMRAVNSILVAAGNLRQQLGDRPEWSEAMLVLRSVNDVNLPKFIEEDLPLFRGITSDLFPGVALPEADHSSLIAAIDEVCREGVTVAPDRTHWLEPVPGFTRKVIQLYEMMLVRHGVMVCGQTCSGKTVAIHTLVVAMTLCNERGARMPKVHVHTINPKSITSGQLYGSFDENTHEWSDGVLAVLYRNCSKDTSNDRHYLTFDGPVDAVWIENMNTVLDDNKKLCLMSGEIIKMTEQMTMMFETDSLEQASPATVSRLGMIFCETRNIGWRPLGCVWLRKIADKVAIGPLLAAERKLFTDLFEWLLPPTLYFVLRNCATPTFVTQLELVFSCFRLMDCFLDQHLGSADEFRQNLECLFIQAIIWSIGACIDGKGRTAFDGYLRSLLNADLATNVVHDDFLSKNRDYIQSNRRAQHPLPNNRSVYDYRYDTKQHNWIVWLDSNFQYIIPEKAQYTNIIVPTIDTVRSEWILEQLISHSYHVLCAGETGTGKSVLVKSKLLTGLGENFSSILLNFSARTGANQTQDIIDNKLEKRRKGVLGPRIGTRCVIFVDDLNMPAKETYGAQPPIELLRQWMDHAGWYNRQDNMFTNLVDIQFVAAMGPPGGGRTQITQRYVRHFNLITFIPFADESLARIFGTIMEWWTGKGFAGSISSLNSSVVAASIAVYNSISDSLLPTPARSHYTFNLRDISKVFQGMLQTTPGIINTEKALARLWYHECLRVFGDRLICDEDRNWFRGMMLGKIEQYFALPNTEVSADGENDIMFGNFIEPRAPTKVYRELNDPAQLQKVMNDFLEDYNAVTNKPMSLVLFQNAIEHVARISRIITQPYGNALLAGVGGSGRKSLTTLAVFIAEYKQFSIEITKSYNMSDWREDLKRVFMITGAENKPTVFLVDDTQIVNESFLEDINGILNTGEVPNLFAAEELVAINETISKAATDAGVNVSSQAELLAFFIKRCRTNLHVVLCLSPVGDAFRTRLRMFPSLINCCTIDWFSEWPEQALQSVAEHFLEMVEMESRVKRGAVSVCVAIQKKASELSAQFLLEMNRHYYVTPTSYLELLNTFKSLLHSQRSEVCEQKARYENGLTKLLSTAQQVNAMQTELEELQPRLKEATTATDRLLEVIAKDTVVANEKKAVVQKEEEICNTQAAEASSLKGSCEADLQEAIPVLESAIKALSSLDKSQITEVKSMKKPPEAVKKVMEAVCIMMNVKPDKVKDPKGGTKKSDDYWGPAQKFLLGDARFVQNLIAYDKDNMDSGVIGVVSQYTANPEFEPNVVSKSSLAAAGLCRWVHAMIKYDKVAKVVAPKRAALANAERVLGIATAALAEKRAVLQEVLDKLDALNQSLTEAETKKRDLQSQITDCANKLRRAKQLINGLGGEKTRWAAFAQALKEKYENVTGDVMLASGVIAYLGCFTKVYRESAIKQWSELLRAKEITCSEQFSLSQTLGDAVRIRSWTIAKLPNDSFSIDNAIMLFRSNRWPLMIDPQGQANRWVRKLEEACQLKVVKQSQGNFLRVIENSVQFGSPVLLENVGELLDPVLEPVLLKQVVMMGGVSMIKIGDSLIEYDRNFRLYMTTKLVNPHYPPELCVKVNLLNFMATNEGLEDQMLGILVAREEPELEAQREKLILEDAEYKRQLKEIEDQILYLLKNSKGNLLDDEVLIETLAQSKITSNNIEQKVKEASKTQDTIAKTRLGYVPVAYRVSQLFFCVADLGIIDPMYQYSLEWFVALFNTAITQAPHSSTVEDRLGHLKDTMSYVLYLNVCRSLFEKDKLLFSFLLTVKIMLSKNELDSRELRFFLQGSVAMELRKPNPLPRAWLSDKMWGDVLAISQLPAFADFDVSFVLHIKRWESIFVSYQPEKDLHSWLKDNYTLFQLLCLLRTIRPDAVVPAVQNFVATQQGSRFVEPPPFNLKACYDDSTCVTPLILVLTPGADPMNELLKLAEELGFSGKRFSSISLGQGQGPLAENAIAEAADKGTWVCLQNCHLSVSWMPTLEKLCEELTPERVHTSFRLWLTSEPCEAFPTYLLQNGVKMTNEPPKGMRANLLGSYQAIDEGWFESSTHPRQFKKMLFGISFFHAVVRERTKFGPLGWNLQYVFSTPDLRISIDQLKMFVDDLGRDDPIPYSALAYLAGECNYGGRVTDDKDRRALVNILDDFYTSKIQDDVYSFTADGTYRCPPHGDLESYREYIRTLPHHNPPSVFGLHENANISCALAETHVLLSTALSLQPRSSGAEGQPLDQRLLALSADILGRVPPPFDVAKALLDFPVRYDESMNTVLTQELQRFNVLTATITRTLRELQRAIKGLVVMSAELEAMGNSMALGQVPQSWRAVAYPSLKPLGSWMNDFLLRLDFLQKWLDAKEAPSVYWISGFFFTQAFITGTLQNFARKHRLPIDQVNFDFKVLKQEEMERAENKRAEDGAYVKGLFLEGARWDPHAHSIAESKPRELYIAMPYIQLWARRKELIHSVEGLPELYSGEKGGKAHVYMCPVYKTALRQGILSTTGHSTNFVMFMRLPMAHQHSQKHWIKRGVAMLTQLSD